MRTIGFGLVLLGLSAGGALAEPNCNLLNVENWSIEPIDQRTNALSVTLANTTGRSIRMIDGSVGFVDALGGPIASYAIDRDASIPANSTYSHTGRWGQFTFERLLKLKPEEVQAWACVDSVLYDDGTVEKFD